ncbi:unnamed protein product, partial [Meganyctiphanes norvegica]
MVTVKSLVQKMSIRLGGLIIIMSTLENITYFVSWSSIPLYGKTCTSHVFTPPLTPAVLSTKTTGKPNSLQITKIPHQKTTPRTKVLSLPESKELVVDSDSLPSNWTTAHTHMIEERMQKRKAHVKQVCHKYGLDRPSDLYQPNAWEFLISKKHNLVWCSVFKAASSTWFYNFNTLAGYTEYEQMHGSKMPMELARKIYNRPSVADLESTISSSPAPTTFMISRHPLTRLVSVYRDKFVGTVVYYRKLSKDIIRRYPHLQIQEIKKGQSSRRSRLIPSFPAFVQFILDEAAKGHRLDEHWSPMHSFCTPCLVDFNAFAKMETLEEDGNYIIFSTGIEDLIAPKKINLAHKNPTSSVAQSYLCQLDQTQFTGLNQLYKLDFEIFQYDVKDYENC